MMSVSSHNETIIATCRVKFYIRISLDYRSYKGLVKNERDIKIECAMLLFSLKKNLRKNK